MAKYPRQKLVMTSPVEFPLYGKFGKTELSKEELLKFWNTVLHRADFRVRGIENLRVCDGSVFPAVAGVNPQWTIFALAHLCAASFD